MVETDRSNTEPIRRRASGIADGLDSSDIIRAITKWRVVGREAFMRSFGGTPAQKYVLVDGLEELDALALLRGARSLAGLDLKPRYRGDRDNVADPLRRLGFFVENVESETRAQSVRSRTM